MKARLAVRVQPGAHRAGLVGWMADGSLRLAVSAPPEGGRANAAVEELLGAALGLPRRQVTVVRGHRTRAKLIEVQGLDEAEARRRLERALEERRKRDGE